MTPHRRDQVESIVEAMRALHPSDWPAMLQKHWSHDVELHLELLSVLASHGVSSDSSVGKPIYSTLTVDHHNINHLAGVALGPYHILQLLGETATSVIYLAYNNADPFKASVTLNFIKPHLNTARIARQFQAEASTLKQLQHPHIARLYDGGVTKEGLLYFASAFVSGRPIDEYCDAHSLRIYDRVKLFGDLCDAVSYAHASLVTHGALIADQVFVTPAGNLQLLDTGIAQLVADEIQPSTKNATSDLRALGVLLYELLCGLKPEPDIETLPSDALVGLGPQQRTLSDICQSRSTTPHKLQRRLMGELDFICLRCLHPDPGQRYRSVESLYADIQRYLSGYPVAAHPDHFSYRARKFILRNLAGLALMAAGVCLLLALVLYFWN